MIFIMNITLEEIIFRLRMDVAWDVREVFEESASITAIKYWLITLMPIEKNEEKLLYGIYRYYNLLNIKPILQYKTVKEALDELGKLYHKQELQKFKKKNID
uniref:Uncharacterized protein n=1 Tax=Glaukea argentea TaxID=2894057 RepID=A0A386B1L2_9CHLO|nr:hypothetical protein [Udotea argentea]AYC65596.1 hypothetical protein [Udotea argentea]